MSFNLFHFQIKTAKILSMFGRIRVLSRQRGTLCKIQNNTTETMRQRVFCRCMSSITGQQNNDTFHHLLPVSHKKWNYGGSYDKGTNGCSRSGKFVGSGILGLGCAILYASKKAKCEGEPFSLVEDSEGAQTLTEAISDARDLVQRIKVCVFTSLLKVYMHLHQAMKLASLNGGSGTNCTNRS